MLLLLSMIHLHLRSMRIWMHLHLGIENFHGIRVVLHLIADNLILNTFSKRGVSYSWQNGLDAFDELHELKIDKIRHTLFLWAGSAQSSAV
jgi:hypothetical protein